MRKLFLLLLLAGLQTVVAQSVSHERMQQIYEEAKTPYKYGLVVAPSDNYHKIDCPTVFRENDKWYMTYLVYNGKEGLDGRGYETWLAGSNDLLHWETLGRVLSYKDEGWDCNQRGGYPSLIDWNWGGTYQMASYKGKHWMTYIGGDGTGYEAVRAPLNIGLAWTSDVVTRPHEWESSSTPILSINDKKAQWWENLVQYKSTVYWDKTKKLGAPFVMFYNAGGVNPANQLKAERIGVALSKDMRKWTRLPLAKNNTPGNPVFANEVGGIITGDAQIVKMDDLFVMFYFSAYDPTRKYNAFNTFAVSNDLLTWQKWDGPDLIYPTKHYDEMFAHKSYVVKHDGIVYHFYCAVNNDGQRGIAVATSEPMGRSEVVFPSPEMKGHRVLHNLNRDWTTWTEKDTLKQHVSLPHNHDDYYGYRQLKHGNLHGTAYYTKSFHLQKKPNRSYSLQLEGAGTYATVILNGKTYPRTLVGRTTCTLHVTEDVRDGDNTLVIKVEHPEMINDAPWVCGGCSSEWGFSEGSQPFGLFRPVTLVEADLLRIEPFGVHVWNNEQCDSVFVETEIHNYSGVDRTVEVVNKFALASGKTVFRTPVRVMVKAGATEVVSCREHVENAHLWSLDDPYLYKLTSIVKDEQGNTLDDTATPFGIRSISWPVKRNDGDKRFMLNGKPVFINGTCEYEHLLGQSHAFSHEQIESRVKMIRQAGFNAFREAHQPHNLRYQQLLDSLGVLFWSQFSAHIWYDTPAFRDNFKHLLRQWIKERRNSPSVILWGLQNESVLPKDFAEECTAIIREMDPTARNMRAVTTCNGGEGTDWNVVQNWSGTYGGDANRYGDELKQAAQLLNGEYGAWRTLGLHGDVKNSEDRFCGLLRLKAKLAEQASDSVCGHFQWLFVSHENPGRVQPDGGYRKVDKIGPINYKGLLTLWEQPSDGFYMFRADHVDGQTDPMAYWTSDSSCYSNCDSVKIERDGKSIHAMGYVDGKLVAEDVIGDARPCLKTAADRNNHVLQPADGYHYVYRINCGGDDYTDRYGNLWQQEQPSHSHSWSDDFKGVPFQASQGRFSNAVHGADGDAELFRTFRYGRHKLRYHFDVPTGEYLVELFFTEPWHGRGGGIHTDCEGFRVFSVACNNDTVLHDLDVWAESGYAGALKKEFKCRAGAEGLEISFPEVKAGQAVVSAIAISSKENVPSQQVNRSLDEHFWSKLDSDTVRIIPKELLPVDQELFPTVVYKPSKHSEWTIRPGVAKEYALRFKYRNTTGATQVARLRIVDAKGACLVDRDMTFPPTPAKYKITSTTTGTQINAGKYLIQLTGAGGMDFDSLEIQ